MSSFHLSHDARERHQLTHVYLAVAKDNPMGDAERQIIVSALFSRADTGLLKHDAATELSLPGILALIRGSK